MGVFADHDRAELTAVLLSYTADPAVPEQPDQPAEPTPQWDSYKALAAQMDGRWPGDGDVEADRFGTAGEYANWACEADVTDEQWAEAFWTAWYGDVDDRAGSA